MAVDITQCGSCIGSPQTVAGYTFQEKTYGLEDAVEIKRDAFANAQILRGQPALDEELATAGSNAAFPLVTFHEDVRDTKKLNRLTITSELKSRANSSAGAACGFWPSDGFAEQNTRNLTVQHVVQDKEWCAKEFIKTYMVSKVPRGVKGGIPMEAQDALLYGMMKAAKLSWDYHAWNGNYAGNNPLTLHQDGFVKKAYQAIGSGVAPVWRWTFSALSAAGRVAVAIGGEIRYYAFDTNLATTLTAIALDLNTTNPPVDQLDNLNNMWTSVVAGATTLTITGKAGKRLNVQIVVTAVATTATWCDSTLEANTPVSGEATTFAEITPPSTGSLPISIPIMQIGSGQDAWDQMIALNAEINDKNPALMEADGFYYAIAPNVFDYLLIYLAEKRMIASGTGFERVEITSFLNKPVVKANYMAKHGIYASHPGALHAGTDLLSDFNTIEEGYERKCEEFWWKHRFAMGFEISHLGEFAGTLENASSGPFANYHDYTAAAPDRLVQ